MSRVPVVLITGATAGIGRHAALYLARKGFHVIATGRRKEALAELKAQAEGTQLETFELDVTDAESIRVAVAEVDRRTNGYGLDVLVNNAGYGMLGPLEMISDEDLRAQYATNVFGLMAMAKAFLPKMRERRAGRIVNVSSAGGRFTFPFMGAYNSSKYAVESLTDALRNEVHPFGVKVVLIEPGVIHTEFGDRAMTMTRKYHLPDSPYAALFRRAEKVHKGFEAIGVEPACVSRAIERAIVGRNPSARYVVPLRTYVALMAFKLLPTRVMDWLQCAVFGLGRR
jgi:NAD(P)-dependent dehydrogenase (short-subunit alcohol dehydrogenase family)